MRLCTGQDMFRTTLILSLVSLSWQGPFKASYYPEQKSSALEKQDWTKYLTEDGGEQQDWRQYMVGEQFFKDGADDSSEDEEYGDQYDYLPNKVLDKNENNSSKMELMTPVKMKNTGISMIICQTKFWTRMRTMRRDIIPVLSMLATKLRIMILPRILSEATKTSPCASISLTSINQTIMKRRKTRAARSKRMRCLTSLLMLEMSVKLAMLLWWLLNQSMTRCICTPDLPCMCL